MDQARIIGQAQLASDQWFWLAVFSTLLLAYVMRHSSRWIKSTLQMKAMATLGALAGVLLWLQAWDTLLLVAAVLTGQALVHLLVGVVWENAHGHWAHWLGRFQWLHYALLLFPLSFWLIARETEAQWTMDLSLQVAIAVSSLLYLSGLAKSAWGFSSSQPSTQTLKILYLCALELGPLLWVIKSYL